MSESFYGIKPCEMPKRVLMHYQSIEFDELPAETQNSIAAMIEVFRNLHLKGEWGWSITFHPHSPKGSGVADSSWTR